MRYDDRLGNPQNVYGNFDWQEHGDDVSLELRSPLGQTLAVVKSTPRAASLECRTVRRNMRRTSAT